MTKLHSYCESTDRKVANFATFFSVVVFFLVSILILNSCTKDDDEMIDSLEDASEVTAPTVSSISPENNAVSVPLSTNPAVTFSGTMDPNSITSSTFTLKQGTSVVAGTLSAAGAIATFKPNLPLTADKTYTGTITTGAKDADGNSLASVYVWSFTTEGATDVTAPTVLTVVPANAYLTAPVTTMATITFSETMNPATINSTSISLKQGTNSIAGTVTLSDATATFTPSVALEANKVYTGNVTTSVKDVAGNAMASNYSWSFTTASASDVVAPVVSSVVPANSATAIAVNSKAVVTFSEAMNAATITSSTFTLKQGSSVVPGVVTYTGTTATFTPSSVLAGNTVYTGTITTGAKDATGNALAANYSWSFTTAASSDNTAPAITTVAPANNTTSVALNSKATATFSEAMNVATITSSTFTLKQGSTNVAGSVTYSGTTATFTPSAALTANTVYTASITTGAKDAAGNSLAATYTWSFTTVAAATGKSFATDVMPILGICNTCHTHNWTTSSNASTFYTNLVNSGHVNPSAPTSGKIYTKVNGGHPSSTVTTEQKNTIKTWVTEGSKNN